MLLDYFVFIVHLLIGCAFDPNPPMEEGHKKQILKKCNSDDIKHKYKSNLFI